MNLFADFQVSIGVKIVINDVAVFQTDLQAQGIIAIDRVMSQEFHPVAFFFVVDQRAVEICVNQKVAKVVLTHKLRIFASAERPNLPSQGAVIGLNLSHALQSKCLTHQVGAQVLLRDKTRKAASAIQFAGHANGFYGFDFLDSAFGGDVFGDQLVGGLGKGEAADKKQKGNQPLRHAVFSS